MSSYNHFGCQWCGGSFNGGNCPGCSSVRFGNEFVYDPNTYSYNEIPNFFNQPPQHQYKTYSCELCGDCPQYGFDCQTQTPLVYEQDPCNNQNFSNDQSPYYSMSLPQQFDYCEVYKGPHYSSDYQAGNTPIYDLGPCYNQNFSDDHPPFYSYQQQFDCCEYCGGPHYSSDYQTRNQLIYEPNPSNNYDFSCFNQPPQCHIDQTLKPNPPVGEPEGSDDYTKVPFDDEQILRQHNIAQVTPHAYIPSLPFLTTMELADTFLMGDEDYIITLSGGKTRVMETSSFSSHHMPLPRPPAYSPTKMMYCYYHPHLTSGDGFDHGPKMK
nr:hypothetical protein [Tanacetum cinerariifolium]